MEPCPRLLAVTKEEPHSCIWDLGSGSRWGGVGRVILNLLQVPKKDDPEICLLR